MKSPVRLAALGATLLLLAGCGGTVDGKATSSLWDPNRVAGLPVTDGASGIRSNAPEPTGTVQNTDGGQIDKLALLSINDIEEYWSLHYSPGLNGTFKPVDRLVSFDPHEHGPDVCGESSYHQVNAMYCNGDRSISWDRSVLLPTAAKFFGDLAVTGVLAHEYGHAIQRMAGLVSKKSTTLVLEQQADCFAGDYMRWVAEGSSSRFELSTGDGLNYMLAGLLTMRDPVLTPLDNPDNGHGTALDRISAFQLGFTSGAALCAEIDPEEVEHRRGDLPESLLVDPTAGLVSTNVDITESVLKSLMEILNVVYAPANPPTLSTDGGSCPDAEATPPASYCPSNNTIYVDLTALAKLGQPATETDNYVLLQGDNTALSVMTSRYALAVQHDKGLSLRGAEAGLRTACLTGTAQRAMASEVSTPSGQPLILSTGDIDEAVAGLLSNGLAASDVDGGTVAAGFTRIKAYRAALVSTDTNTCYNHFP